MYPVMLNIKDRVCTVIGGGEAAKIKAAALIKAGATVRAVYPEKDADITGMDHIAKKYDKSDLTGSFMVIAATDNEALNRQIISDAAEFGILSLNASDSENSDFIPMAHISDGDVTVAASTGGAYPMLARQICGDVDVEVYNKICGVLKKQRRVILGKNISREEKRALLRELITDKMIALAKNDITAFEKTAESAANKKFE